MWGRGGALGGSVGAAADRRMNKCLPQNLDFYKNLPKAADLIFAGAVDLYKIYAEGRKLTLPWRRKKKQKSKEFP